jgi:hypothetical protein
VYTDIGDQATWYSDAFQPGWLSTSINHQNCQSRYRQAKSHYGQVFFWRASKVWVDEPLPTRIPYHGESLAPGLSSSDLLMFQSIVHSSMYSGNNNQDSCKIGCEH